MLADEGISFIVLLLTLEMKTCGGEALLDTCGVGFESLYGVSNLLELDVATTTMPFFLLILSASGGSAVGRGGRKFEADEVDCRR